MHRDGLVLQGRISFSAMEKEKREKIKKILLVPLCLNTNNGEKLAQSNYTNFELSRNT
jgi:hypothetical protein